MNDEQLDELEDRMIDCWESLATQRLQSGLKPQKRPWAVIIAGQPGAGKSVLVEALRSALLDEYGSFSLIDPAELVAQHPLFPVLAQNADDVGLQELWSEAADLASRLLDYGTNSRANLVLSCTFSGSDATKILAEYLQHANYTVHWLVLAVEAATSRPDFLKRQAIRARGRPLPQVVNASYHDEMHREFLAAVAWLDECRACNVKLLDREGRILAEKKPGQGYVPGKISQLLHALDQREAPNRTAVGVPPVTGVAAESATQGSNTSLAPGGTMAARFSPNGTGSAILPAGNEAADNSRQAEARRQKRRQFVETLLRMAETEQQGVL